MLGVGWTVTEKLLYFVPFAVLLPVGGWLLAREIMGRTKWALLTPVLLLGATYFMLESNGEVPLALGEVVSFFVLIAFLKTVRQLSFRWALITGVLLSVVAVYDVRPAYLCVLLMADVLRHHLGGRTQLADLPAPDCTRCGCRRCVRRDPGVLARTAR